MSYHFGAHVPWSQIDTYLNKVIELGLAPEFAIKGPELDILDDLQLQRVADTLKSADIRPSLHAPFFDLNPGALDPLVREVTATRLCQALDVAQRLNSRLMVIHPGVDKWRYPNLEQSWCEHAKNFFEPLSRRAEAIDCRLALENIYEETPDVLVELVDDLDSKWFGHCFDIGHWHLFGKRPIAEWFDAIGPKLVHLHLHDNHGRSDEHLPVGSGTIDFRPLVSGLAPLAEQPSITLEAHSLEHLTQSLSVSRSLLTV